MSFWLLDKLTHEDRADPVKVSLRVRSEEGRWAGGRTEPVCEGSREKGEERRERKEKELTW